jgi:hypothetical protein
MKRSLVVFAIFLAVGMGAALAQQTTPGTATAGAAAPTTGPGRRGAADTRPYGPATLPGKGLAEFNFLYGGEAAPLQLFVVKDGKVDWKYTHPRPARGAGEISDASMQPNGNILFATQYGAAIVTPEKRIIWSVDAAAPTEIHTATMIDDKRVAYIVNGTPARLHVVDIATNKEESSFQLPTQNPALASSIHGQFRHMRMTPEGKFLVAHMDMGKVVEYDKDGNAGWSASVQSPWAAERLMNGNTLIASNSNFVREVNAKGETVWEFRPATDVPEYRFWNTQTAVRLANGNTLISNWHGKDAGGEPVQFIEVTPEKKVVWALRSWTEPANLGTSSNIQILDAAGRPDPKAIQ